MPALKHHRRRLSIVGLALFTIVTPAARADVDRTPKPGGIYKMKPGIFVAADTPCESPPNVAIRSYDGLGISTAHTRACSASILSKRRSSYGSAYRVTQTCIDAGSGPGKRFTERQSIDIPDALNFTITTKSAGSTAFRYCPIYQLPAELRSAADDAARRSQRRR